MASWRVHLPWRLGFRGGLSAGAVAALILFLIMGALWSSEYGSGFDTSGASVRLRSSGAALSRRSAGTIILTTPREAIRQVCRDGCDDLGVNGEVPDSVYEVRVLSVAGRCIACGWAHRTVRFPWTDFVIEGGGVTMVTREAI